MQISTQLEGALSLENIRVNVPSIWTIAISTAPDIMTNAAIRLLGLNREEIAHQARDIIFGQLRLVIASMKIEDINRSREHFVGSVQKNVEMELKKLGLELINVNIINLEDQSGYLVALGQKAAQEAIQKAQVDVAEQEKIGNH
jgi:flotillin